MVPYCILVIEDDDDRAFMENLYEERRQLMYWTALRILRNEWWAEDVVQEVTVKLIDKIPELRGKDRDRLVNYIISACKNTAYNYLRDHGKREFSYDDYIAERKKSDEREPGPEPRLIHREELECLARVWPELDERTQFLLEGYYILEKTMAELGTELGMKENSVRMSLTRARREAQRRMDRLLEK